MNNTEIAKMILAYLACGSSRVTTDRLRFAFADRFSLQQIREVCFALNDAGKISYKRDLGWKLV